jgi:3-methyladenine DNA glycosylase AlkC
MSEPPAPALKEIFNLARIRHIAKETAAVSAEFDSKRFLARCHDGLEDLSLMQRLGRVAVALYEALPSGYLGNLAVLRRLAPRLNSRFVTMVLPDYVARYGLDDFDASMAALKFFTPFGSSEFAVRCFLRQDLRRGLAVMETWSRDDDEHVRRLASEGSRPRLPWSFRLEALVADPSPVAAILDNLKADPSLYVRKSVANHLNDITKDHPGWALDRIRSWPLDQPATMWIARHALRSLIKRGDREALTVIGAGEKAELKVMDLLIAPNAVRLGEDIALSFRLESTSPRSQRLVVDYAVHYVKRSGGSSAKVFKLKTLTLEPHASVPVIRHQRLRDFTTRVHYAGRHRLDILVNGECLAQGYFDLLD